MKISKSIIGILLLSGTLVLASSCSYLSQEGQRDLINSRTPTEPAKKVLASYYGTTDGFHGKTTASGEKFDAESFTAAHKTYPFGTKLRVTNPKNGKSVIVRVNDRGPFAAGRSLDLSEAAARQLEITKKGVSPVEVVEVTTTRN